MDGISKCCEGIAGKASYLIDARQLVIPSASAENEIWGIVISYTPNITPSGANVKRLRYDEAEPIFCKALEILSLCSYESQDGSKTQ